VPRPAHANPRSADARQHNRDGRVLSGQHWRAYQVKVEAKEGAKQVGEKGRDRARYNMWEGKRANQRAAELALKAAAGDGAGLSVKKMLKTLVSLARDARSGPRTTLAMFCSCCPRSHLRLSQALNAGLVLPTAIEVAQSEPWARLLPATCARRAKPRTQRPALDT
jgi:hypothetical protein